MELRNEKFSNICLPLWDIAIDFFLLEKGGTPSGFFRTAITHAHGKEWRFGVIKLKRWFNRESIWKKWR